MFQLQAFWLIKLYYIHSLLRKLNTQLWLKHLTIRTDPVIGEVLINDLPHLSLLVVKDVWGEEENHIQHAGLGGQSCTAMLWTGES